MSRHYNQDPEYTKISTEDKAVRDRIVAIIASYTREMENYDYCGTNPGVAQDDYEDVAEGIMQEFGIRS